VHSPQLQEPVTIQVYKQLEQEGLRQQQDLGLSPMFEVLLVLLLLLLLLPAGTMATA
jgi:hypothetical protein